jgi:ankyrin repeat protein
MDTSGRNLQELCRSANSDARVREDLGHDSDMTLNFCKQTSHGTVIKRLLASHMSTNEVISEFLDQENSRYFVKNKEIAKKTFHPEAKPCSFEKINALSLSLHQQDSKGITALHVAVYKNSVHVEKIAKLLLDWNYSSDCSHTSSINARKKCSLASIQMKCGSCPLHIVTGQNLTIKEELLKTLLLADSSVVLKEDANGDNPLSLLWKNTLVSREKKIKKK